MANRITKERRSWNMSRIKKNTKPELLLRSMLHKAGYCTAKMRRHPKLGQNSGRQNLGIQLSGRNGMLQSCKHLDGR